MMEEFIYDDLKTLAYALPEDVQRRKDCGDFDGAQKLIDRWLMRDVNEALKRRLRVEKWIIRRLPYDFPDTFEECYAKVKAVLPDMTVEKFRDLQLSGRIDWIYVNGEERFFNRAAETLLDDPKNQHHSDVLLGKVKSEEEYAPLSPETQEVRSVVKEMQETGKPVSYRFRIRSTFHIAEEAFRPGHVRVWIPVPRESEQISDIRILEVKAGNCVLAAAGGTAGAGSDGTVSASAHEIGTDVLLPAEKDSLQMFSSNDCVVALAPAGAHQRTICFDDTLTENADFQVTYEFTVTARYAATWDPAVYLHRDGMKPVYAANSPAPCADDLAEQLPHIQFTPYMRALAKEIIDGIGYSGDEHSNERASAEASGSGKPDALEIARAFYDYVTTKVKYSYMRQYFTCEELSEYAAINHKGDCGIQALMFITLCRIAGIPARWQSSLNLGHQQGGCHDWAQFYIDGFGWLFCDPSFGGGAHDNGDEKRREFYFGNLDPFRMVANDRFQTQFTPAPKFLRDDPYDNQLGEAEYDDEKIMDTHTTHEILVRERL